MINGGKYTVDGFNDIKEGDQLEVYIMEEIPR